MRELPMITSNPIIAEIWSADPIVDWLIPDLLPKDTLTILAGIAAVGKSFTSYTLGMALATGTRFLDRKIDEPQRVVYFDNENAWPDRVQYERRAYMGLGEPDPHLLAENFWCFPFELGGQDWLKIVQQRIEQYNPELVIIDTAASSFPLRNENDNAEAMSVLTDLRRLHKTVLLLKHATFNIDSSTVTIRGAKAWEGGADAVIYQLKNGEPDKKLTPTKLVPGKTRAFGLSEVIQIDPMWTAGFEGIELSRRY